MLRCYWYLSDIYIYSYRNPIFILIFDLKRIFYHIYIIIIMIKIINIYHLDFHHFAGVSANNIMLKSLTQVWTLTVSLYGFDRLFNSCAGPPWCWQSTHLRVLHSIAPSLTRGRYRESYYTHTVTHCQIYRIRTVTGSSGRPSPACGSSHPTISDYLILTVIGSSGRSSSCR